MGGVVGKPRIQPCAQGKLGWRYIGALIQLQHNLSKLLAHLFLRFSVNAALYLPTSTRMKTYTNSCFPSSVRSLSYRTCASCVFCHVFLLSLLSAAGIVPAAVPCSFHQLGKSTTRSIHSKKRSLWRYLREPIIMVGRSAMWVNR